MAKRKLIESFEPKSYMAEIRLVDGGLSGKVEIVGKKLGRPSKRLTLHQKGIKITAAKLTKIGKKTAEPIVVSRTNYHKGFEEVRLHTDEMLFPGDYKLDIVFTAKGSPPSGVLKKLAGGQWQSARHIFPLVDEPGSEAVYNIRYAEN